jgi:hypothetical protein
MISHDPWPVIRARYARAIQRGDSPERISALRAELRAVRCRDYLVDVLAAEPPLTEGHRIELAGLILTGAER